MKRRDFLRAATAAPCIYRRHFARYNDGQYGKSGFPPHPEVDFLLRRGRDHLAIEVKSGTRLDAAMLSGLKAIGDLPRMKRRILVYLGTRRLKTEDGIEVWPLPEFLERLSSDQLWP